MLWQVFPCLSFKIILRLLLTAKVSVPILVSDAALTRTTGDTTMTILIAIKHDADLSHFRPAADDCAPFEYDLTIDGLDAEIREVVEPGYNGIPQGGVFLDGDASAQAIEAIEALPWADGVASL